MGYGIAEAILENGGRVTISSSNPTRVSAAVASLETSYPSAAATKDRVRGFAANMGEEATLEENVKRLFEQTGKMDHVVYTAGDSLATIPIHEASFAQIKQAGMVRYFAVLIVARYVAQYLEKSTASSFTMTTGSVSQRPMPGWGVVNGYATALQGTTRGLALDLKPIRVNLVSPGAVDTPLWDGIPEPKRTEVKKSFEVKMATGKIGQVEDVVEAFLYCLKDRNLTGSMISTNGGALIM